MSSNPSSAKKQTKQNKKHLMVSKRSQKQRIHICIYTKCPGQGKSIETKGE
jgi:hypothetical protein